MVKFSIGDIFIYTDDDKTVTLTPIELGLLVMLIENAEIDGDDADIALADGLLDKLIND